MTTDPVIEHLHNQLIAAIYGNVVRDLPDPGVAPWVSANDKPTVLSKPVSGDAAEQRLKTEVMQLPARDRRRLKEVPEVSGFCPLHCVKVPSIDNLAGGLLQPLPKSNGGVSSCKADQAPRYGACECRWSE